MMKRAISVGFSALLILSALVVMNIVPVTNVSATGNPVNMGGYYVTAGDWIVDASSPTSYSNTMIIVNGNLTIKAPFTLDLSNVELLINGSYNGVFNITVESGAGIDIQNGCNITSYTPDNLHMFGFVVEGPAGSISMTDSELHECGWDSEETDIADGGLNIQGGSAVITGNEISDNYFGVIFYGATASGATVSGNHFHNNTWATSILITTGASGIQVTNNNINDNYNGIYIELGSSGVVEDNNLNDNFNGIFVTGVLSTINIEQNTVRGSVNRGISINTSVNVNVNQNLVEGSTWAGISGVNCQGLTIDSNYVNDTWNGISFPSDDEDGRGISVSGCTDTVISNNYLYGNAYAGIAAFTNAVAPGNTTIINNYIVDTSRFGLAYAQDTSGEGWLENNHIDTAEFGLFVQESTGVRSTNNYIENCGGVGTFSNSGGINSYMSMNLYYENNVVRDCDGNLTRINGHYTFQTNGVTVEGDTYEYNEYNLHVGDLSSNILVKNSTLTKDFEQIYDVLVADDLALEDDAHVTLLNTTFDETAVSVGALSERSSLTVQWYLHVKVVSGGMGEDGADIYVYNVTGARDPGSGQPFTTSGGGYVNFIPVTWFVENSDSRNYYTPHDVFAQTVDKEGWANPPPTMDQSKLVVIPLNTRPVVDDIIPIASAMVDVLRTTSLQIQVEGHDLENDEDELIPYIQYRVNDTSPWTYGNYLNNGTISYSGTPDSGHFEITFTPPATAPLDSYDVRAMFEDLDGSYSDWFVSSDSINVTNNHPYVEIPYNESSTVLRSDSIDIWVDGQDIEDGDDQNFNAPAAGAVFEYRVSPSGPWETDYLSSPYKDGSNWRAAFSPPASPTKAEDGFYDFRFKFYDNDGDESAWETRDRWIDVLNNPPIADSLDAGQTTVFRNGVGSEVNFVWLFANVTELEDLEQELDVLFEYNEPTVGWSSDYIDPWTLSYDYSAGLWRVKFIPPSTAATGFYNFKVTITDLDEGSDYESENALVQVMNNPPTTIPPITTSDTSIRAGVPDLLHVQVEAEDAEDADNQLTIGDIEWQASGSSSWSSDWFGDMGYDPAGPFLWVEFEPPSSATPGLYNFRVKVMDLDGDMSDPWLVLNNAVEVKDPKPDIEYVKPQVEDVFRGEEMTIRMKGSDAVNTQNLLIPHLEFKKKSGGTWTEISTFEYNSGNEYWEVYWTPDKTLLEGQYEFRGRFENSENAFSDYLPGDPATVTVHNNIPTAVDIGIVGGSAPFSVDRMDTITLYANGDDVETLEQQLIPYFQYSIPGDTWDSALFSSKEWDSDNSRWIIDFAPDVDAVLEDYSFQVYFKDGDQEESAPVGMSDTIAVNNVIPIVEDLTVTPSSEFRGESIVITANGADGDGAEGALVPTFEYKSPSGGWTPVPGNAIYSTSFRITWTPGADEEKGDYSFRVKFADDDGASDWYEVTGVFELKNNVPEVDINSPERDGAKFTFSAIATDEEDSAADLAYEWDFGDGSDTSSDDSPSHTYSKSGSYTVTLTITDNDGDTAEDEVTVNIGGDVVADGGLDFITLLLLIIIIVVVVVLLLVLLMGKRKKKPEDAIPPAAAPMAPGAPPAAAPMAAPMAGLVAGPEVAAPAAVPMAAPAAAAVPAAVPAAAPAAAAAPQKIKCPKCGTAFEEARTERPITIQCPSCGAKGTLN